MIKRYSRPLSALAAVVVVLLLGYVLFLPGTLGLNVQPFFTKPLVPVIAGPTTVGQLFVADYPGLSSISFLAGTNARVNHAPVRFQLRDAQTGQLLSSTQIDPSLLRDNHDVTFVFPPIENSAGRAYLATLAAPTAGPNDGITLWGDPGRSLAEGRAYIAGVPTDAELTFRLSYHLTRVQIAEALVRRMAAGRPGPWGWPTSYAILALAYVGGVVVLWLFAFALSPRRHG